MILATDDLAMRHEMYRQLSNELINSLPPNLRAEYDRMLSDDRRVAEQMQRQERVNRAHRRAEEARLANPVVDRSGNHIMGEDA